jgi:hypothetical protein
MPIRFVGLGSLASVALVAGGCRAPLQDDLGSPLVADAAQTGWNLVWTADGAEVVYARASDVGAARVADGTTREVATPAPFGPTLRTADGSALYYIAGDRVIHEAVSGRDLTSQGSLYLNGLAVSADGRQLMYADADVSADAGRVVLVDVATGATTQLRSCTGPPLAFSPAGSQGLCGDRTTPRLRHLGPRRLHHDPARRSGRACRRDPVDDQRPPTGGRRD